VAVLLRRQGQSWRIAGSDRRNGPLIDYVLTVAVSISSGVANIASAFPVLLDHRVELAIFFIVVIAVLNLREYASPAPSFAAPTYLFIGSILVALSVGAFKLITGVPMDVVDAAKTLPATGLEPLGAFLGPASICLWLRRAHRHGSDLHGVTAFKPPEAKNAAATLVWMGIILGVLFFALPSSPAE